MYKLLITYANSFTTGAVATTTLVEFPSRWEAEAAYEQADAKINYSVVKLYGDDPVN